VRYRARVTETEDGVEVESSFELLRRRISLGEYAQFHRVLEDVRQAASRTLTVAIPSEGGGR
jgi:hypothetical protein